MTKEKLNDPSLEQLLADINNGLAETIAIIDDMQGELAPGEQEKVVKQAQEVATNATTTMEVIENPPVETSVKTATVPEEIYDDFEITPGKNGHNISEVYAKNKINLAFWFSEQLEALEKSDDIDASIDQLFEQPGMAHRGVIKLLTNQINLHFNNLQTHSDRKPVYDKIMKATLEVADKVFEVKQDPRYASPNSEESELDANYTLPLTEDILNPKAYKAQQNKGALRQLLAKIKEVLEKIIDRLTDLIDKKNDLLYGGEPIKKLLESVKKLNETVKYSAINSDLHELRQSIERQLASDKGSNVPQLYNRESHYATVQNILGQENVVSNNIKDINSGLKSFTQEMEGRDTLPGEQLDLRTKALISNMIDKMDKLIIKEAGKSLEAASLASVNQGDARDAGAAKKGQDSPNNDKGRGV